MWFTKIWERNMWKGWHLSSRICNKIIRKNKSFLFTLSYILICISACGGNKLVSIIILWDERFYGLRTNCFEYPNTINFFYTQKSSDSFKHFLELKLLLLFFWLVCVCISKYGWMCFRSFSASFVTREI